MNAVSRAMLERVPVQEAGIVELFSLIIVRCKVPVCVWRYKIVINRGKELMRV